MTIEEKADFYIKCIESWNHIKLSDKEKQTIIQAYKDGYEDGRNSYRD